MRFLDRIVAFFCFVCVAVALPREKLLGQPEPRERLLGQPEPRVKVAERDIWTRIVGGSELSANSWPFLVQIGKSGTDAYQGIHCGGSIINANFILTAAHCFHNIGVSRDEYRITAGEHDLDVDEGTEQRSKVAKIMLHPDYNSQNLENDVAVIKLETPIDLSKSEVAAMTLNTDSSCPTTGQNCKVAGWGDLQYDGSAPDRPREVTVPIISNSACDSADDYYTGDIFDTSLCALYPGGGKDSCQGDSGGPFICTCGGSDVHVGIVSWGYKCAEPGMPGVYARTSSYIAWVNGCIANNGDDCPGYEEGGSGGGGGGGGGATGNPGRALDFDFEDFY